MDSTSRCPVKRRDFFLLEAKINRERAVPDADKNFFVVEAVARGVREILRQRRVFQLPMKIFGRDARASLRHRQKRYGRRFLKKFYFDGLAALDVKNNFTLVGQENFSVRSRAGENRAVKMIEPSAENARQNRGVLPENFCGSAQSKLRVGEIFVGGIFFDGNIFFARPIDRNFIRAVEIAD